MTRDYGDLGMTEEEARARGWKPPPPEMTPEEEALKTLEHELEKDAQAQLKETNDWNPSALGMWGDVLVDELDRTPLVEVGVRTALLNKIRAIRWAEGRGMHPYFGAPGEWSWFDAAALIDDMGDDYSDVPNRVYKLMAGEVKAGHRCYKTGVEAVRALLDAAAAIFAEGGDPSLPADAGDEPEDDGPDNADDPDHGVPHGA